MNYEQLFKGKKITVMGLGLLGRGVGDVDFLARCGAQIVVTDKKSSAELAASVQKLEQYKNVSFKLGGHDITDFTSCDMVLKAAGVPLDSPEIAAARAAGVRVVMSTALFAKYAVEAGAMIVGVTGTRGKSTIAHMIFHCLNNAGKRVHLGGNIRGTSTLASLSEIEKGDIAVLELDSWQLQGFGDLGISPHVAVFTNLMPDHMNYYGGDMEKYFSDKAKIFENQKSGDVLFVGSSIASRVSAAHPPIAPTTPVPLANNWELSIPGVHNRENASFAVAVLRVLGLADEEIYKSLRTFNGVEGRLQFVGELNGVKIYNDNNATTPEATIAALRALGKNVTLIVGGSEKNLPLEELISEIERTVTHVILLVHPKYQGSVRLSEAFESAGVSYEQAHSLQEAFDGALAQTKKGTILFSPAFASFGMFNNEYERNDQFLALVKKAGTR